MRQTRVVLGQSGFHKVIEGGRQDEVPGAPMAAMGPDPAPFLDSFPEIIRNVPLLVQLFFWYFGFFQALPPVQEATKLPGPIYLSQRGLYRIWFKPTPTFWIWMILDCAGRTFPNPSDKTTWLLVLVLVGLFTGQGWLAALIYYFMVKRKYD